MTAFEIIATYSVFGLVAFSLFASLLTKRKRVFYVFSFACGPFIWLPALTLATYRVTRRSLELKKMREEVLAKENSEA